MAYSNIKRDKKQILKLETAKNWVWGTIITIVMFTSGYNIFRQWSILRQAHERNLKLSQSIQKIEEENARLKKKIEIATESAYILRKQHEYLGLGSENDYWLEVPKEASGSEIEAEINEVTIKPNLIQWWELFTR